MHIQKTYELNGKSLTLETGLMAKQADGAVLVQYGDTVILATVVASKNPVEYRGFFPLSVEYREKAYAAGKIPGGFFKREGRPHEKEVLSARLIDRPIRPLFPDGFLSEVQVVVTVLSADKENDPDVLGIIGASAALSISDIPFEGPIAGVRIGRTSDGFIVNPTFTELENSDMDIIIAASKDDIAMVEGEAAEISEADLIEALEFGHNAIKDIILILEEMVSEVGKQKREVNPVAQDEALEKQVREQIENRIPEILSISGKIERRNELIVLRQSVNESLAETFPDNALAISEVFHDVEKEIVRRMILEEGKRIDGRGPEDIRAIDCQVSVLPRTHGSALFTRGETQSLTVTTLGTKADEQKIERLEGSSWKSYTLHYNFPPFSVGEVKPF